MRLAASTNGDTTEFRGADDVTETNNVDFRRWRGEFRRKVVAGRMRSFLVVMATPDPTDLIKSFSATFTNLLRHSNFSVWRNRSTWARRFGDIGVFRFTFAPLDFSTSSNRPEYFASLSRITYSGVRPMSSATIRKFLACRLTHAESGCTELAEIHTCREPKCRNTSRYRGSGLEIWIITGNQSFLSPLEGRHGTAN